MPDQEPIPPAPQPSPAPEAGPSSTGLPSNIAAAIACIPLIGGIIFYLLEKRDSFVRFYAMQSIIFGGAWILFAIVYSMAHPAIGLFFAVLLWIIWALVSIGFLVLFIVTVVKAFTGVRWEIPYIGPMARKQMEGGAV